MWPNLQMTLWPYHPASPIEPRHYQVTSPAILHTRNRHALLTRSCPESGAPGALARTITLNGARVTQSRLPFPHSACLRERRGSCSRGSGGATRLRGEFLQRHPAAHRSAMYVGSSELARIPAGRRLGLAVSSSGTSRRPALAKSTPPNLPSGRKIVRTLSRAGRYRMRFLTAQTPAKTRDGSTPLCASAESGASCSMQGVTASQSSRFS